MRRQCIPISRSPFNARHPSCSARGLAYAAESARGAGRRRCRVNRGTERRTLRLPAAAASDLNINAAGCARAESCIQHSLYSLCWLVTSMSGPWTARTARKKRFKDPRTHLACTIDRHCTHCFVWERQVRALPSANNASAATTNTQCRWCAFFCYLLLMALIFLAFVLESLLLIE